MHDITDRELWDARLVLKNKLIDHIRKRVSDPKQFRFDSPRQMIRIQESLRPDVLTIGAASRPTSGPTCCSRTSTGSTAS